MKCVTTVIRISTINSYLIMATQRKSCIPKRLIFSLPYLCVYTYFPKTPIINTEEMNAYYIKEQETSLRLKTA